MKPTLSPMKPETTLVNLTPHPITIRTEDGFSITLNPDGPPPRLEVEREELPTPISTIRFVRSTMGAPTGLPAELVNQILIVSALVAEHPLVAHRTDLAYPGEAIRDADGRITGCRGLCAGPGLARSLKIAQDWTVADTGHPNDDVCPNCGADDHPAEECAHRLAP